MARIELRSSILFQTPTNKIKAVSPGDFNIIFDIVKNADGTGTIRGYEFFDKFNGSNLGKMIYPEIFVIPEDMSKVAIAAYLKTLV